ncbi:hypothetical protein DPMN_079130 [Dreissena polymorpha]|uniref:Uncharacterized protein n=1 Tax=Dreissena polymorpha TaxID=45954 RepID=A0A9D3YSJ4_DREPO|nr:hypothetical protein DPMN_079130 [Dreissena polymorpha]
MGSIPTEGAIYFDLPYRHQVLVLFPGSRLESVSMTANVHGAECLAGCGQQPSFYTNRDQHGGSSTEGLCTLNQWLQWHREGHSYQHSRGSGSYMPGLFCAHCKEQPFTQYPPCGKCS